MSQEKIDELSTTLSDAIALLNSIKKPIEKSEYATLLQKMAQQIKDDINIKIPPTHKTIIDKNY